MEMLWLNQSEVRKLLAMRDALAAVEEAFRQHGLKQVQMPVKIYLDFKRHSGDLRCMPAYLEELDIAGVKIVNVHPNNPKKGLPSVMAVVLLNDPRTGAPLAAMDGTYLTDMRTGAAGGIAAKYLARRNSKVLGIVGSGRQARTQLLATSEIFNLEQVKVASRSIKDCEKFKREMEKFVDCEITIAGTVQEVCDCDILATTTPVREPIVKSEWILEGTHINAIGADAPGKEELEPSLLKRAKVVVDDSAQAVHSGEVNVPIAKGLLSESEIYAELGEIIAGKKAGRESESEITIFDSTGLAIQDVATASMVYRRAKRRKIGRKVKLF